jgi:hypothetical protein
VTLNPLGPERIAVLSGPTLMPSWDQELWDELSKRPNVAIQIPTTAVSVKILNRACILDGWILRETTGIAPAVVEFFDGADATGQIIGEQTIPGPSSGAAGGTQADVDASAANAAAANNVTLPGVAGQTTFITGFEITGAGATAGSVIVVTVTGILGGTKTYQLVIPTGAGVGIVPLQVEFSRPIPASAVNTAIVVNVPSFGAGNTNAAATAHGFQQLAGASGANAGQTAGGPAGIDNVLVRSGVFMRVISGSVTGTLVARI